MQVCFQSAADLSTLLYCDITFYLEFTNRDRLTQLMMGLLTHTPMKQRTHVTRRPPTPYRQNPDFELCDGFCTQKLKLQMLTGFIKGGLFFLIKHKLWLPSTQTLFMLTKTRVNKKTNKRAIVRYKTVTMLLMGFSRCSSLTAFDSPATLFLHHRLLVSRRIPPKPPRYHPDPQDTKRPIAASQAVGSLLLLLATPPPRASGAWSTAVRNLRSLP